jgi:hypothetical protein
MAQIRTQTRNFTPAALETLRVETWQHNVPGETYITRVNELGKPTTQRIQGLKKTMTITPLERHLYEEACVSTDVNPFRNGRLVPLVLIDDEPDTAELQATPNAMSETAMKALFNSQIKTFVGKVEGITNPITLNRLREIAVEVDAKASQMKVLEDRLDSLSPGVSKVRVGSDIAKEAKASLPER